MQPFQSASFQALSAACMPIPSPAVRLLAFRLLPAAARSCAAAPPQRRTAVEAVQHYDVSYFLRDFFSAFNAASTCGTAVCAHAYRL